jgi:5'/3'-nucleotidase
MIALSLLAAACGSDDTAEPADGTTTTTTAGFTEPETTDSPETATTAAPVTTPEPEPLRILLTNDDGLMAEGIDRIAKLLMGLANVEVTIVAPADNQSGTSDSLSDEPPEAMESTTASGLPAVAVSGTPGDSVLHGLRSVLDEPPHLIVSGANDLQNIGPFALISGTVGATRIGAREGIPGLAVSVGGADEPDFDGVLPFVADWIETNRDELLARETGGLGEVVSINSPTCGDTGALKGLLEVPLAEAFGDYNVLDIDCSLEITDPASDVEAFVSGWAAQTVIPADIVAGTAPA